MTIMTKTNRSMKLDSDQFALPLNCHHTIVHAAIVESAPGLHRQPRRTVERVMAVVAERVVVVRIVVDIDRAERRSA